MVSIFRKMSISKDIILHEEPTNDSKIELITRVEKLIESGVYSAYKKKDIFLRNRFDDDSILARKLGMNVEAVRKVRSRMSAEAYNFIGVDTCDIIAYGSTSQLREVSKKLDIIELNLYSHDILPMIILSNVDDVCSSTDKVFGISDCKPELDFLHWLSNKKIRSIMSNLDIERLRFLIDTIDGKLNNTSDRVIATMYILRDDDSKSKFPPKRDEIEQNMA